VKLPVGLALALAACRASTPPGVATVPLPDGRPGIGFDDLRFSATWGVLAPAGRTGNLALVDEQTHAVTTIGGFSQEPIRFAGHDQGATSVDEGAGFLFVTDRDTQRLSVIDPSAKQIVASATLAANPDYVRYVPETNELWVTEPDSQQIEVFTLDGHQPVHAALISAPGGPESLVIDRTRARAYTNTFGPTTYSVDVRARQVVEAWPNGCQEARGIALDEIGGFVFAGCLEGRGTSLDVTRGGALAGMLDAPVTQVDIIDYAPGGGHLYLPGAGNATLAIVGVSATGALTLLATVPSVSDGHCVTADDRGNAWICDTDNGQLLVISGTAPRSTP
jgi:DNA-binding beta-propeller fold protein YncE